MNQLLHIGTVVLAQYLSEHLPALSKDWWKLHVEDRLSFQQQRLIRERKFTSLEELDFAALLRLLDQNWYELSRELSLPREARTWVKELQTIRNKWANLSAQAMPASEIYRDADTLGRLLKVIGADEETILVVEAEKAEAVVQMSQSPDAGVESDKGIVQGGDTTETGLISPNGLFSVGDLVSLRSDTSLTVPIIEVQEASTEFQYVVFQDNRKVTYFESQLKLSSSTSDSEISCSSDELRAYLTSLQLLSPSTANLFSLQSGRINYVPYQYRPVLKLVRADRPRLLIADEVGVGKTIEAGLIIKELRARQDISSVLIICPKALVAERKWELEMKRFDEKFTALDGTLLRHCIQETHLDGEWPEQYAKSILPFSLFDADLMLGGSGKGKRKNKGIMNLDPPPKFDLVIVDEAHHIRNPETYLHQGVRYFCDNAQAVIFLTATPVQLGSEDLFTLLNVLRPDVIVDRNSFEKMSVPNKHINIAIRHCREALDGWQLAARSCLDDVAATEWGRLFLCESREFQAVYDRFLDKNLDDSGRILLITDLEELYTFSTLINRTRRRDIGEFTSRKPTTYSIEFSVAQQKFHDDLMDLISRILEKCHGQKNVKFMMTTVRRQAASCVYGLTPLLRNMLSKKLDQLESSDEDDKIPLDFDFVDQVRNDIESILEEVESLDTFDPKVEAFVKVLNDKSSMANNKTLVFSTFRHTLAYLSDHTSRAGLRFGVVHGDVADDERSELRRRFSLPKEDHNALDILLSSEVGCEGLDFQFCDLLVNYDLPWNPMRIEQRIGRIDRYGQKSEAVVIANMITPGTVDADIYERCLWRIGVFHHAVGGGEVILGEVADELRDIADDFLLSTEQRAQRLQQLSDNGIRQIQEEQTLEKQQAQLFGLNIPNQKWRDEIEEAESFWLSPASLNRCVSMYLKDRFDSDKDLFLGETDLKTLRLNREARVQLLEDNKNMSRAIDHVARQWQKWLKGKQPTLSVTFDQKIAHASRDAIHLNVLHPLVRQAASHFNHEDAVQVSLTSRNKSIAPGNYAFRLYQWQKRGVKADEVLVSVATHPKLEKDLLSILEESEDIVDDVQIEESESAALDERHHSIWSAAQANHIYQNRQVVEYQLQSLTVSHSARMKYLNDRKESTTNEKIRRMRESELMRAEMDYESRMSELRLAAESGDIHVKPVVIGMLSIT